jgi:hypothetical protein
MKIISFVGVLLVGTGVSFGSITGVSGSAVLIAPPPSVVLNALESDTEARAFNERDDLALTAGLRVDITIPGLYDMNTDLTPGVIPAGTVVSSHYLYSDPVSTAARVFEGAIEFDQPILGIIISRRGLNESDAFLGALGTTYADNDARGLELGNDRLRLEVSRTRVVFRFSTAGFTDDIRVITIPTPGSAGIACVAAIGLVARPRRRS